MKLFTASFYSTDQLIPAFDFDDIDDLVELIDELQENDGIEFDTSNIKIDTNSCIEFENEGVIEFISQFDELNYSLMVEIGDGEFDQYWEDDCISFHQYQYLIWSIGLSAEDAIEKSKDVDVYFGTIDEYAEEKMSDSFEIPDNLKSYIDYGKYANDLNCNGEVVEYSDGVCITNGYEF